jgi:uncharacterized protein
VLFLFFAAVSSTGGNMLEDLKYLIKLQEIDLRIKEQELAQENFPAMVEDLNAQIAQATAALNAIKEKMVSAENERHNWEEQVQKAHTGLEKSQERLNSIKTNREYDAVHAEIEAQKNIINGAEQRRKSISAEIDKLQQSINDRQADLDRITLENTPKITELQQKISAIDSTILEITKERDVVLPSIGKHILRQYDLIRSKRKNGRVISNISTNRTCSVCYKVLEPQLFNEIKRGVKVQLCQSCGSIMIWQPSDAVS